MEEKAVNLQEALERIGRLEAEKEKIFEIISLWLGSPLNSLKMLSDMLVADVEADRLNGVKDLSQHLSAQVGKTHKLMQNLIMFSSLQIGNIKFSPSSFAPSSLVSPLQKEFEQLAVKKGISLYFNTEESLEVTGDKTFISLVLENLLSNALKFTRKGDEVSLNINNENDSVAFIVKDTGIGMGPAKMAKIFNPERKSTQKGTANESGLGLGMPIIKGALALHKQTLTLESQQGKGTKATFYLPIA